MNDFESLDVCSIQTTGTRTCPKCKTKHDRKGNSYCKECHNKYQKEYYKKNPESINKSLINRRAKIKKLIEECKNIPCADCGIKYPPFVMDFDHLYDKEFNISIASNKAYSEDKVWNEIKKCEVVCANCHRIRTFQVA